MLLCGAKKEHNVSEWQINGNRETFWQQNQVLERYYWGTCIRKNSTCQPRWRTILSLFLFVLLLVFIGKNTSPLFDQNKAKQVSMHLRSRDCVNCKETNGDYEGKEKKKGFSDPHPVIVLEYEAEIADDDSEEVTTIKPPPSLPDEKYMKNISTPRPPSDFSITPWKVIERLNEPVHGRDCVRMKTNKRYMAKWSLVILVKSKSSNYDRRTAVRQTWGRVYFLNQIRIEKVFVVGQADDPTVQEAIQAENDIFGDILQYEGPDDYKNMPIKVATAMQWAATNLAFDDFYASSDDDFVVDFVSIVDFLEYQVKLRKYKEEKIGLLRTNKEIRMSMPIYCVYYLDKIKGPNRDKTSKWFVNETEYSLDRYPPYCGGGFYMMPVSMAYDLYKMSRVTRILAMDDVWVTGILRQKLRRGDDNVVKAEWPPTNLPASDETKKLWKHLWGDYGMIKKDVAKLLPEAWEDWNKRLKGRPHCMAKEQIELEHINQPSAGTDQKEKRKNVKQMQKKRNKDPIKLSQKKTVKTK